MYHYLVNSQEMKQCDQTTIEYYGVLSAVLMERAALAVFHEVTARFPKKKAVRILVLCGAGNNGGDGFAVARLLHLAGYPVEVLSPFDPEKMTAETRAQYRTVQKYGVPTVSVWPEAAYDILIDALFGIGLSREIEGDLYDLLDRMNRMDAYKIAVDIASGVSADSGQVLGIAFCADLTVTFGFAKIGQLLYPGAGHTGELLAADIGIDFNSFLEHKPFGRYLSADGVQGMLPKRRADSHKGVYGRALIIAGSANMAGAAYFSAKAAYYSGCGLVRILTAQENRQALFSRLPEAIITPYDTQAKDMAALLQALEECMDWADAVLIGPGLGQTPAAQMLVAKVLQYADKKIVFDADALNILSKNMVLLKETAGIRVMTPHIKEMGRLTRTDVKDVKDGLLQAAREFAREYQAICVLKDTRTVVGMPEGDFFINTTGNHGMATGGSGDVLAGFLTGFLAQGQPARDAAALAVYLHGRAGDLAALEKGAYSMLASDILEKLPLSLQEAQQITGA